ncbi:MAG TPA: alpha/beta hydrolase [Clostridia bacterium]|nr:alpha/beta hydrolase [Clostridia bacterium]
MKKDISYKKLTDSNAVGQNTLDLYQPNGDKDKSRKVVILVHGGGFTGGDKSEMSDLAYKLAQRGYVALSVNYTLGWNDSNYSETALTTTTSDIVSAVDWLKRNSEKYRVDINQMAIGGMSAGGYISVDTALSKSLYHTGPKFFAVIDMFGGMRAQTPSEESPPILMIHGDKDNTVPISESYSLKSALDNAGVYNELFVMKGAGHGITSKYYDEALFRITKFLYKTSQMQLNPLFETEQDQVTATLGESTAIRLKAKRKVDIKKFKICMPKGCRVDGFKQKNNGSVSFNIDIPESCDINSNHILSVEPVAEKLSYGKTLIVLKVAEPVEITVGSRLRQNNEDKIQNFFIIKNKSKTRDIRGNINVKDSKNIIQKFSFKSLKPGEEKKLLLSEETFGYCSFNVELKSGLKRTYTEGVFVTKAYKTNEPPQIDGSLNDWKHEPSFILDDKSQVKLMTDWGGTTGSQLYSSCYVG